MQYSFDEFQNTIPENIFLARECASLAELFYCIGISYATKKYLRIFAADTFLYKITTLLI